MGFIIAGLVCSAVAAVVLAFTNSKVLSETRVWLHALQASAELQDVPVPGRGVGDIVFTGRDRAYERTLGRMNWLTWGGWLLFAAGAILQLVGTAVMA